MLLPLTSSFDWIVISADISSFKERINIPLYVSFEILELSISIKTLYKPIFEVESINKQSSKILKNPVPDGGPKLISLAKKLIVSLATTWTSVELIEILYCASKFIFWVSFIFVLGSLSE